MDSYTVDANALLGYLVDAVPTAASELFDQAERGDVVLELPTIAATETVYMAAKGVTVRGTTVSTAPADVADALDRFLPVTVVADDRSTLREVIPLLDPFPSQIHDAMIVASHRVRDTEAVVTADTQIASEAPTVWS
jgi:predicted nucleic acid-binding protein